MYSWDKQQGVLQNKLIDKWGERYGFFIKRLVYIILWKKRRRKIVIQGSAVL